MKKEAICIDDAALHHACQLENLVILRIMLSPSVFNLSDDSR
jgi:hypothetical protein